ncbi:MAG TPA: ribose 5-phosphate isomerase B [Anaerolineaceae bacterium]|jgi:ribose 5-phosphate isomerase B
MKIAIGSDHVAYRFKLEIEDYLKAQGIEFTDFGTDNEERTSYPIYATKACRAVLSGEYDYGLLFCGTGIGMSLTANKIRGIRAVVCSEPYSAVLSRQHNNTNVLCLGARVVGIELAKMIIDQWLAATFEGGRHQERLDMIAALEHVANGTE